MIDFIIDLWGGFPAMNEVVSSLGYLKYFTTSLRYCFAFGFTVTLSVIKEEISLSRGVKNKLF